MQLKYIFLTRTQNPRLYRAVHKIMGLLPNPKGIIDSRIKIVGRQLANALYEIDFSHGHAAKTFVFDDNTFIAKAAYKNGNQQLDEVDIYNSKIPFCHDPDIDNYMRKNLDWKNGDALILLGYYNNEKVKNVLINGYQLMSNSAVETSSHPPLAV